MFRVKIRFLIPFVLKTEQNIRIEMVKIKAEAIMITIAIMSN